MRVLCVHLAKGRTCSKSRLTKAPFFSPFLLSFGCGVITEPKRKLSSSSLLVNQPKYFAATEQKHVCRRRRIWEFVGIHVFQGIFDFEAEKNTLLVEERGGGGPLSLGGPLNANYLA